MDKEQYWNDMATCPAPSLKYWSPWSFGKQHFEYHPRSTRSVQKVYKPVATPGRPGIPLIHERNALTLERFYCNGGQISIEILYRTLHLQGAV